MRLSGLQAKRFWRPHNGTRDSSLSYPPSSYPTLQWLDNYSRGSFTAQILGEFEEILVVEFRPVGGNE